MPVSLMNMDAKIFNQKLAKQIREYIKCIIYHDQEEFILRHKDDSIYSNQ
jgi:hypothetical protein